MIPRELLAKNLTYMSSVQCGLKKLEETGQKKKWDKKYLKVCGGCGSTA